ncbi:hypothetical protein Golax_016035, partial [Gossypium laxum]|nr:hypothetical protein [Gossypium laxum]
MVDGSIYYYLFNTLLFCLLVVHIYWWILMIRVIMRQVKSGGQVDDVRSDGMRFENGDNYSADIIKPFKQLVLFIFLVKFVSVDELGQGHLLHYLINPTSECPGVLQILKARMNMRIEYE